MSNSKTVAVIGAGALGLTVAYRLQQRGFRVTLLEANSLPGGLAAGFPIPPASEAPPGAKRGAWLEKFYHHIFRSDTHIIKLIEELGLGSALIWQRPLTVTMVNGKPYQLDSPLSLLRFEPMTLWDRLRMGMVIAYLRALPTPASLEGRTATRWLSRAMGAKGYGIVFEPLLKGKFGQVASEIAMPWFWARIHDRTPQLGYIRGGFQRMYNTLADKITQTGGEIRLGVQVHHIDQDDGSWIVMSSKNGSTGASSERFDLVVSTLPTRLTCKVVEGLPETYKTRYDWGRAYSAHCQIYSLDRPLTASYWMNINDPGYPFMVLCEHTNFMPPEDYGGRHLIYLGKYGPSDDPLFSMSPQEAVSTFLPHLKRINPNFDPSWIREAWVFSSPFAQPIVTTEYKDHIPPFDTPLPGLYVGSMFQVYPHDRGQNYSIALGERLAEHIAKTHDSVTGEDSTESQLRLSEVGGFARTTQEETLHAYQSSLATGERPQPIESSVATAVLPQSDVVALPLLKPEWRSMAHSVVNAISSRLLDPWLWLSLLAIAGLFVISDVSTIQALDRDEGAFATIAQAINHGQLPYRDLFDQQGPGVYFLFAFILRLFAGSDPAQQVTILRLSADAANALTAVGLTLLGKKLWSVEIGALAGGLWLVSLTQFEGNYFMTEPYMTTLSVMSVLVLISAMAPVGRKVRHKLQRSNADIFTPVMSGLCAGILLALGSMFKQTAILEVPGILVLILGYYRTWPTRLKAIGALGVGGCLSWLAVCAYFASQNSLHQMLNDVIFANLGSHYPGDSRETMLLYLRIYVDQQPMIWLTAVAFAVFGAVALLARVQLPSYKIVSTYLIALGGFAPILQHDYPHYWLQPMPWVCLIVAFAFGQLFSLATQGGRTMLARQPMSRQNTRHNTRHNTRAFAAGALLALAIGLMSTESWLTYRLPYDKQTMADQVGLATWVNRNVPADASLLVGPANPEVYFLTGRPSPVNYVYLLDVNAEMIPVAARQVSDGQFQYVVWNTSYGGSGTEWDAVYTALQHRYHEVSTYQGSTYPSQGFVLYVRNSYGSS